MTQLECTSCKHANLSDAEFCLVCGSPLIQSGGVSETATGNAEEMQLAEQRIKNAYVGGVIRGTATLLLTAAAIHSGTNLFGLDAWALLDAALVYGLTYGVYKKSRVCAGLLLAISLIGSVIMLIETQIGSGLPPIVGGMVFGYHFFRGLQGTIAYHRLVAEI